MEEWKRPPPKFTKKKKKIPKEIKFYLTFTIIEILLFFIWGILCVNFSLDMFSVILLFLAIFVTSGVAGFVFWLVFLIKIFEGIEKTKK